MSGRELTAQEMADLRAYFRQWVNAPIWDANPEHDAESQAGLAGLRDAVGSLTNRAQIRTWLWRVMEAGIDPL